MPDAAGSPEVGSVLACIACASVRTATSRRLDRKGTVSGVNEKHGVSLDRRDKLKHIIDPLFRHDRLAAANSAGVMVFLPQVIDDGSSVSSRINAFDLSPSDTNSVYRFVTLTFIAFSFPFLVFSPDRAIISRLIAAINSHNPNVNFHNSIFLPGESTIVVVNGIT